MGYYTDFTLNISNTRRSRSGKLCLESEMEPGLLAKVSEEIGHLGVLEDGDADYGWYGNAKWYSHDEDMLELSKKFPTVLFTLFGDGEETEDLWYTYYLNGAYQHAPARIVYDDFSEDSLNCPLPF